MEKPLKEIPLATWCVRGDGHCPGEETRFFLGGEEVPPKMGRHCDNCDMFKSEIGLKLTRYSSLGEERISKIGMIRSPLAIVFLWRSFGECAFHHWGFLMK
jgi:hypothetical protein